MKVFVTLILLLTLCMSCSSEDTISEMTKIDVVSIAKGNLHGNGIEGIAQQNIVVNNQITWTDLIDQMNTNNTVSDNFSEVDIDFFQYIVIAVFDDVKPNGGHSIDLNVMFNSEIIKVEVTSSAPQGNATTELTQPFSIIKMPKSELPIIFQ